MRIISFVNGNSGPSFHRLIVPLLTIDGPDVYITNNLQVEDFEKGCDLFIYNRILPDHAVEQVKELKTKYGFKVCVDIDDFWELDDHHVLFSHYKETGFAKKQIQHIVDADLVTTTHSRLADEIRPYNKNVHVLPNAIPKQGQFKIDREPYYLTRLFWQGSITHRKDIEIIAKPIEQLGPMAGKIKMVMGGYQTDEEEWDIMARMYTANLKHQYKLIPGAHVNEYYSHYKHADICLVPLIKSRFNGFKSNLKVLEAANLGLPVICSEVHPYLGLPVIYANHTHEWVREITRLVESKKRRKEVGRELQEYCDKHFNFKKINQERKEIFEHAISKQTV